jgi:hypothetical protein
LDFVFTPAEWQVQTQSGQRFFYSCGMLVKRETLRTYYDRVDINYTAKTAARPEIRAKAVELGLSLATTADGSFLPRLADEAEESNDEVLTSSSKTREAAFEELAKFAESK